MINWRSKRGSILAEAIVAVTTLVAGVIALGTIINNAVAATGVSKDYLVAQNLLTEGVESIKVIRATNWMMWPQLTDSCWMVREPGANGQGNCAPLVVAQGTNYVAEENVGKWRLRLSNRGDLDLSGNVGAQSTYRLYTTPVNPFPRYVHTAGLNTPSKFYRSVKPVIVAPSSVLFEVKIQWLDGSKVREVKRNFTIYNYI